VQRWLTDYLEDSPGEMMDSLATQANLALETVSPRLAAEQLFAWLWLRAQQNGSGDNMTLAVVPVELDGLLPEPPLPVGAEESETEEVAGLSGDTGPVRGAAEAGAQSAEEQPGQDTPSIAAPSAEPTVPVQATKPTKGSPVAEEPTRGPAEVQAEDSEPSEDSSAIGEVPSERIDSQVEPPGPSEAPAIDDVPAKARPQPSAEQREAPSQVSETAPQDVSTSEGPQKRPSERHHSPGQQRGRARKTGGGRKGKKSRKNRKGR